MIHKSYLVENNLKLIKNNLILFYGENLGLLEEFEKKFVTINDGKTVYLRYFQEDVLDAEKNFIEEINNPSLFDERKIFLIKRVNDKILKLIEEIIPNIGENKIVLFSELLEKKSKLRNFFEKDKRTDVIPCYKDNETGIKKIIQNSLKDFSGLSPAIINSILECCNNDRVKMQNEITKIKSFFDKKKIIIKDLNRLLNSQEVDDFNIIKNNSLAGKKLETNKLLNSTVIDADKTVYYVNLFNQRLVKLKEVIEKKINIEQAINELRPPVFWKDKPEFLYQAKIWDSNKLNLALQETYNVEMKLKSNSIINKKIIIKKLVVDICNLANAA